MNIQHGSWWPLCHQTQSYSAQLLASNALPPLLPRRHWNMRNIDLEPEPWACVSVLPDSSLQESRRLWTTTEFNSFIYLASTKLTPFTRSAQVQENVPCSADLSLCTEYPWSSEMKLIFTELPNSCIEFFILPPLFTTEFQLCIQIYFTCLNRNMGA